MADSNTTNAKQSHAIDPATTSKGITTLPTSFLNDSLTHTSVPPKVQQKAPGAVEDALPNKVHDTGNPDKYSHDKGHTHVPQKIAEALPKKVEEKVPDAIHDTSGKKSNPEEIRAQANRAP